MTKTDDPIDIRPAVFPRDLDVVRALFVEYARSLDVDLAFQDFETELATLPGKYAAPAGRLLIARRGDDAVGCVAMRALGDADCEMKRLFVRPTVRGTGLGRRLAERICDEAREAGHARILLDTLPTMADAQRLYATLGFEPIAPYVFNPVVGTKFLAKTL